MKSSPVDTSDKHARAHARAIAPLGVRSVQRRVVAGGGAVALLLIGSLAWWSLRWVQRTIGVLGPEHVHDARQTILLASAITLAFVELALLYLSRFIGRRVTEPATALAVAAERVAARDLAVELDPMGEDDELGRLARATGAMIAELRRLVGVLRDSARETAAMSAEITAGTEEMSAASGEMAHTANDLSRQASEMAHAIAQTAGDAATLVRIAGRLTEGAHEGVERNARLRGLARENRSRLDESSAALGALGDEARTSADAAEELAIASEEVRSFVTLVRKIARQSKLLALNASMEAARAGEQGEGFAVVASEIRKLATSSAEAAERTEDTIDALLARVEEARASSQRTAATVAGVQRATREAMESFSQVEGAVAETEGWTSSIEDAARESRELLGQATIRLDELARGTESFAAAMQQVAAATEEQSAGAEEIASAAAALADASRRLLALVSAFRIEEAVLPAPVSQPRDVPAPLPAAIPAPAPALAWRHSPGVVQQPLALVQLRAARLQALARHARQSLHPPVAVLRAPQLDRVDAAAADLLKPLHEVAQRDHAVTREQAIIVRERAGWKRVGVLEPHVADECRVERLEHRVRRPARVEVEGVDDEAEGRISHRLHDPPRLRERAHGAEARALELERNAQPEAGGDARHLPEHRHRVPPHRVLVRRSGDPPRRGRDEPAADRGGAGAHRPPPAQRGVAIGAQHGHPALGRHEAERLDPRRRERRAQGAQRAAAGNVRVQLRPVDLQRVEPRAPGSGEIRQQVRAPRGGAVQSEPPLHRRYLPSTASRRGAG